MTNAPAPDAAPGESLKGAPVYLAAAVCLVAGLAAGYVSRGWQPAPAPSSVSASRTTLAPAVQAPSLDAMKQVADKQAAPLLENLKGRPADSALLAQAGAIYHSHHQFKQAAAYFEKAVQADPKNPALRTSLASSLYRSGDTDGAIAQLNRALADDPNDANALFNLGMIRLEGKGDGKGALAAWRKLLKSNPQLSPERKAEVQKLMANVLTTMGEKPASERAAR